MVSRVKAVAAPVFAAHTVMDEEEPGRIVLLLYGAQPFTYPGEQPAIVDQALWARVQQQLKLETRTRARHGRVEALLSDLLYCGQCAEQMRSTYSSRQGQRYLYYVCRNKTQSRNANRSRWRVSISKHR